MNHAPRSAPAPASRVLLWHWGRHGGGPRCTLELARALAARDDVELFLSISRQAEIYAEFDQVRVPRLDIDTYTGALSAIAGAARLSAIRERFGAFMREKRIDVVVCSMTHLWNNAMLSTIRAHGTRYVLVAHDGSPHPGDYLRIPEPLIRREMRLADHIITLSDHVRDEIVARDRIDPATVTVSTHGAFRLAPSASPARRLPAGHAHRLLCFGRMLSYKGLDMLLDAYAAARGQIPGLGLKLAGKGSLGALGPRARALGVEVDNRYIPERELSVLLSHADVMVLPYREASQSGVAMLAFGAGMPVIATPVGGLREQVRDRETGLLADEVSAEALTRCILELCGDADLYSACSDGAARCADTQLRWEKLAADVILASASPLETIPAPRWWNTNR